MGDELKVGTSETRTFRVDPARTIDFMGEDARVYATPSLVMDIENTCRDLIASRVPDGQDSVGTVIAIAHTAPTLIGMDVEISVTVAELDGRSVAFEITASDPLDKICKGRHERFIVDVQKTKERLLQKAEKAKEA